MARITEFYNQGFYNPGHRFFSIQLHELGNEAIERITTRTDNNCAIIIWMLDLFEECLNQTFYANFVICLLDKQGLSLIDAKGYHSLYPTSYWRIYLDSKKLEIDLAIGAVLKEYGGILNQPDIFNNLEVLKIRVAKTCLGVAFDRAIPIEALIQKVADQVTSNMEKNESELPFEKNPWNKVRQECGIDTQANFEFEKPHKSYEHCLTKIFSNIIDSESSNVSPKTQNVFNKPPVTESTDIEETSADSERILARKKRRCRKKSSKKVTIFYLDFKFVHTVSTLDPAERENLERLQISNYFPVKAELYNKEFPSLSDFSESDQAYMGSDERGDSDN